MTDIKSGDRVKVTIEGTVFENGTRDITVGTGILNSAIFPKVPANGLTATVEKIEPPVEVFKPGDIVRDKSDGTLRTPLEGGGWVNITTGRAYPNIDRRLTSENYERVNIE